MSDARKATVHEAWAQVMSAATGLAKGETANAGGTRFNFRGIDAVMNYVGPILRQHQVSVIPSGARVVADREVETKAKAIMRNVTVEVTWTVYGPDGSSFTGQSLGESSDSGDKSVSKAHSVAYRTFLLQSLCLPTDEEDPDHTIYEQAPRAQADRTQVQPVSPEELDGAKTLEALRTLQERAQAAGQLQIPAAVNAFAAAHERIVGDHS